MLNSAEWKTASYDELQDLLLEGDLAKVLTLQLVWLYKDRGYQNVKSIRLRIDLLSHEVAGLYLALQSSTAQYSMYYLDDSSLEMDQNG